MVVIRPVQENDLKAICEIAAEMGTGVTSLPNNQAVLADRISRSLASFSGKDVGSETLFFFVMESVLEKEVVGTCAIDVQTGESPPFYSYKLINLTQKSSRLQIYKTHKILELVNDYQNTSELGTLCLKRTFRGQGRGELLSRSRFLFIAEFPQFFSDCIISEMRGFLDEKGNSPFWDAIGRYFFEMDFSKADYLRMVQGEQFITDLMPKYPIYVDLLPKAAQDVIGKTHLETAPAIHLLEREGFKYRGYVDIFQGGPLIEAEKSQLKTVQESRKAKIHTIKKIDENKPAWMISNAKLDFRVALGNLEIIEGAGVNLDEKLAKTLNVSSGDFVRYCALHHPERRMA